MHMRVKYQEYLAIAQRREVRPAFYPCVEHLWLEPSYLSPGRRREGSEIFQTEVLSETMTRLLTLSFLLFPLLRHSRLSWIPRRAM